jgi:hypothetical protein
MKIGLEYILEQSDKGNLTLSLSFILSIGIIICLPIIIVIFILWFIRASIRIFLGIKD